MKPPTLITSLICSMLIGLILGMIIGVAVNHETPKPPFEETTKKDEPEFEAESGDLRIIRNQLGKYQVQSYSRYPSWHDVSTDTGTTLEKATEIYDFLEAIQSGGIKDVTPEK